MRCREALSARIDGEDPGVGPGALDAHLARCAACKAWLSSAGSVTRGLRIAPAEPRRELTMRILAAFPGPAPRAALADSLDLPMVARVGLAFVALAQLALALPGLAARDTLGVPTHLALDLVAWDVALAVGFLFVAWRPDRAVGMLPLVAALVVLLLGSIALSASSGQGPSAAEAPHVTEVAGLALLWLLARLVRPERPLASPGGLS